MKVNDVCPSCQIEHLKKDPDNPDTWLVCNECGEYFEVEKE